MSDRLSGARARRAARMLAKLSLADSTLKLAEALLEPPEALRTCPLWGVLRAAPGMGRHRCRQVCEEAQVWPLSTLEELTREERYRLATHRLVRGR